MSVHLTGLRQAAMAVIGLVGLGMLAGTAPAQEVAKPSPFAWLEGHKGSVYAVQWSPDGKTFLSASVDGTIGVWDATTGKLTRTIRDARGGVLSLAIAKDGLQFAAGGVDRKVRMYDLPSTQQVAQLATIPGVPTAAAVSADGRLIFTADGANTVRLWNPDNNAALRDFGGSTGGIVGLAIFPTSRGILAASKDGFVRSWNIDNAAAGPAFAPFMPSSFAATADEKLLAIGGEDGVLRLAAWPAVLPQALANYGDLVTGTAVSPDGKLILVGSADTQVILYNAATGVQPRGLTGQPGKTTSVAFSPDSVLAASGSELGNLKFWQVSDGADRLHYGGHVGAVTGLAFHPKQPLVATSGADGTVRVWNLPSAPKQIPGHTAPLVSAAVSRNGKVMATAGDKTVRIYKPDGTAIRATEALPAVPTAVALSDDGAMLVIGDATGGVRVEAAADGKNALTLGAHNAPVSGLAFHPDGKRFVSVGHDGSLKFWNLPTAAPAAVATHADVGTAVAVSADGKLAVSASNDGAILAFDPAAPKEAKKIEGPGGPVTALAVNADSSLLAATSNAGVVKLANPADGADKFRVAGHTGAINAIAFNPKAPQFATAGVDGTARIWRVPTAAVALAGNAKPVQAVSVTADGKIALVAGADGLAQLFALPEGKLIRKLAGTDATLHAALIRRDGLEAVTGDANGVVRLSNVADGVLKTAFGAHEGPITGIAYHPSQPLMATVGADGTAKLWQVPPVPAAELTKHTDAITAIVLSSDGATTISAGADKAIRLNAAAGVRQLGPNFADAVRSLALSGDNVWVAAGTDGGAVTLLNVADGAIKGSFGGHVGAVNGVAINPANTQIATAGADGTVRIWEAVAAPVPLAGHTKPIAAISLSPNGQWIATAAGDNTVRLWNASNNTAGPVLSGHSQPVTAINWRADSTQLVSGSADKTVRVWNVADGKQLAQLDGSEGAVGAVAITPDGARVLAGGADKSIRIWTTADMKPATPPALAGHTDAITGLTLIAGGATVVSSSKDGTIRTWTAADGKQVLSINAGAPVNALAVSVDEKLFAAAGQDKSLRLFTAAGAAGPVVPAAEQPIVAAAFSRDNLRVAGVTADGTVRVADVEGKLIETVSLDKAPATAVAFGADARTLLVGTGDNSARIVKLGLLRMAPASAMALSSIVWTPDGNSLITGGVDKTVRLLNAADLKVAREFGGHTDAVTKVAVTKDATKVLAAGADKTVRAWTLANAAALPALTHPAAVRAIGFNADATRLVTGCDDNSIRIFDMATGKLIERFLDPTKPVTAVAFAADGKTVVSGSLDLSVRRHTLASKWFAAAHEGGASAVTFNLDGTAVITGGADKLVKQFDLNGAVTRQFAGAEAAVRSLALRVDGMQLAGGCENGHVCFWTFANAALERKVITPAAAVSVAYSIDNTRLAAAGADGHVRTINPPDGVILEDVVGAVAAAPAASPAATSVAFGADNLTLVAGYADNTARVHPLSLIRHVGPHVGGATAVAWSPDGLSLFTGGADKTIVQWTVMTGAQVRPFPGHTELISGLAVSADGVRLISASPDKTLRQWTIASGAALNSITNIQPIRTLSTSVDGNRAATLEDGNTLRTWDLVNVRDLERVVGHEGGTTKVAISGDGKSVVSVGVDKTARLWVPSAVAALPGDVMKLHDVAVLADGSHVVTGGDDKMVKLWDMTGKLVRAFGGLQIPVKNVAVSGDGLLIAAGGDPQYTNAQLVTWKTADAGVVVNVTLPSPITSVTISGDARVAAACVDKRMRTFSTVDAKPLEDSALPAVFPRLAILPDNRTIFGAGNDNFAYLTKVALANLLTGHMGIVHAVAYLPDGRLVSGGADKSIRLWDAEGKPAGTFAEAGAAVYGIGLSADGKRMATAGGEVAVRLYDVPPAGEAVANIPVKSTIMHPAATRTAKLSPDGTRLVTGCEDGWFRVWDVASGKQLETLPGTTGTANTAAWSPDGKFIVTGGGDRFARKFTPAVTAAVVAHEGRIADVKFSADGSTIYTSGADKTVAAWAVEGLKAGPKFTGAEAALRSVAVSEDGKTVAAGGEDKQLRVWSSDGKPVASIALPDVVTSVLVADNGKKIIAGCVDKNVRSYGIATVEGKPALEQIQEMIGHTAAVNAMAVSADGKILYTAGTDQILRRWHSASYGPVAVMDGSTGPVYSLEFSPDGKLLAGAGGDKMVRLWTTIDGKPAFVGKGHERQVNVVVFSPNGKELASAGLDGTIRLWSAVIPPPPPADGKPVDPKAPVIPPLGSELGEIKEGVEGPIFALMYTRDGQYLLSAGAGRSWQSFIRKDLKFSKSFPGHNQTVYRIGFNPAGTRIATLDYSGNFVIWNSADGNPVFHVQLPANSAYSFSYAATGQEIVAATSDSRVLRFQIPQFAW